MKKTNYSQKGVALLMSLGILALLATLGAAFATGMRLGQNASLEFLREIQVRYAAEAGIQRAIGELKYHTSMNPLYAEGATNTFIDSRREWWYYGEYSARSGEDDSGKDLDGDRIFNESFAGVPLEEAPKGVPLSEDLEFGDYTIHYDLKILDTGSQINVNYMNENALSGILQNLCNYLGISTNYGTSIFSNRPFLTKYDLKTAFDTNGDGKLTENQEELYNLIKDFLTINSYRDPNNSNRSPINVNTASWQVIASILVPILEGDVSTASRAGMAIFDGSPGDPSLANEYPRWENFAWVLENYAGGFLNETQREDIFASVNPNRVLNENTDVKFGFNSSGYYEIECIGIIRDKWDHIVAQKKISATVKIFDMWNQTTREEFNSGSHVRSDVDDNCPVRADDNWNCGNPLEEKEYNESNHSTNYLIIKNAIKIGYWDGFDENERDIWWNKPANPTEFNGVADMPQWGEIILGNSEDNPGSLDTDWSFSNCAITVNAVEQDLFGNGPNGGIFSQFAGISSNAHEVGWLVFRYPDAGGIEDSCTEYYIKRTYDSVGNETIWDPPFSRGPLVYTIRRVKINEWIPINWWEETYNLNKTYKVVENGDEVRIYLLGDDISGFNPNSYYVSTSFARQFSSGWIKLSSQTWADAPDHGGTHWDNLRVIPDTGYYISTSSNESLNPLNTPEPFEWGTLWATFTRPETASTDDVNITFQYSTDGGTTWSSEAVIFEEIMPGVLWNVGIPINSAGQSIQYRANFYSTYSDSNQYFETPVLEDVWITYLPKTKILYWREGVEEPD